MRTLALFTIAVTCCAADRVVVIAHRGEHLQHTENTLPAFQAAIELGADYIEVDVRTTKDGKLVLMHDGRVDRTTNGTGEVSAMTFDDIRALEVRGGGKVPTFDEALDLAAGRIGVYVDCKQIAPADLVSALERHNMLERSVIYGGWQFLRKVHELNAKAAMMPEARNPRYLKQIFSEGTPNIIAFDAGDFTDETIAVAKDAKAKIYVDRLGAADNETAWDDAVRRGADGIQTDHPGELVRFLKARGLH